MKLDRENLLTLIAREKTQEVLQAEKELILQAEDPQKRSDLLATAVMVASRHFDLDFLWDFFHEEVKQMQASNFIQDWIQEGLQQGIQ